MSTSQSLKSNSEKSGLNRTATGTWQACTIFFDVSSKHIVGFQPSAEPAMPWSDKIVRSFQKVPINPSEADFHGPYNKLLYTLFPGDTDYTITWHYMSNSRSGANFILFYEVLLEDVPVFVLELKPPQDLRYDSTRGDADRHIRRRLQDLRGWSC